MLVSAVAQTPDIPLRPAGAPTGSAFAASVRFLHREAREEEILLQITQGNIPPFMRNLVPVTVSTKIDSLLHTLTYFVLPDYLAIGSDDDYFLVPMCPILAQRIADTLDCLLPTRKLVNDIYREAVVKLRPQPIRPSPAMVTVPVFLQHNDSVRQQRQETLSESPLGTLVGGSKKDVVVSTRMYSSLRPGVDRPVVIYGWHKLDGEPIQPLYNGHSETYADYSHGIRLVSKTAWLNGKPVDITDLLRDRSLHILVSDEGVITRQRYGTDKP
jgi:hypothetical protein